MDHGNDFLKEQIHHAVLQHRAFLRALENHESQADDARFRDLCTRYMATMQEHQAMLENYESELGPPSASVLRRTRDATVHGSRDLGSRDFGSRDFADTAIESDFQRLVRDLVMSAQAEDAFRIFREAGRALDLRHLAELGEKGEREHDSYKRDANRLAQQMFVEGARDDGRRGANRELQDLAF